MRPEPEIRTIVHRPPTPDELRQAEADKAIILNLYSIGSAAEAGIPMDPPEDWTIKSWLKSRGLWQSYWTLRPEVVPYLVDWDTFPSWRAGVYRKAWADEAKRIRENWERMIPGR